MDEKNVHLPGWMPTNSELDLAHRAFVDGDGAALAIWRDTYGVGLEAQAREVAAAAMLKKMEEERRARSEAAPRTLPTEGRKSDRGKAVAAILFGVCVLWLFVGPFVGVWSPLFPNGSDSITSQDAGDLGLQDYGSWNYVMQQNAAAIADTRNIELVTTKVNDLQDGQGGWTTAWQIDTEENGSWVDPALELDSELGGTVQVLVEKHDNEITATFFKTTCGSDYGPADNTDPSPNAVPVVVKVDEADFCFFR